MPWHWITATPPPRTNLPVGFACACNAGFSGSGVVCTANDCADDSVLTSNSFQPGTCSGSETTGEGCVLTCSSGYELNGSGAVTCDALARTARQRVPALTSMNARETRADQQACAQTSDGVTPAVNTYYCACAAGYENGGEQAACTDVNECAGDPCRWVACAPGPRMESLRRWIRSIVRVRPGTKTVVSKRRVPT